jgi:tripartite-type tricarboxylate transporter receptor subunit TctC
VARKVAEVLTEKWGQPVIVDNRPGGSGIIGLNYINNEPANGYTIGFFEGGTAIAYAALYKNSEPIKKLELVVPVLDAKMALFASGQIRSYDELKQEILKNPSYSSWGIGSIGHVLGAEYLSTFNANGTHIPYKDFGQWQADVAGRQVTYAFGSTGSIKSMVQSGKTQIFAIASNQRDPRYPNIPTIREVTGKNINTIIAWCGFFIPVNTPSNLKAQLEKDIKEAAADPRVQETMSRFDFIPMHNVPLDDFKKRIKNEHDQYSTIISKYNIEAK